MVEQFSLEVSLEIDDAVLCDAACLISNAYRWRGADEPRIEWQGNCVIWLIETGINLWEL